MVVLQVDSVLEPRTGAEAARRALVVRAATAAALAVVVDSGTVEAAAVDLGMGVGGEGLAAVVAAATRELTTYETPPEIFRDYGHRRDSSAAERR